MTDAAGTILVADDEESIRFVVSRALEQAGHRVVAVDSGAAALEELLSGRVDAAFIDIKMPGMDGLAVLTRVRERASPRRSSS